MGGREGGAVYRGYIPPLSFSLSFSLSRIFECVRAHGSGCASVRARGRVAHLDEERLERVVGLPDHGEYTPVLSEYIY